MTTAIFFDFDGVIMDSMGLKLDAFCHAFAAFDLDRAEIRRLQEETAGLSRQLVITRMYETLVGDTIDDAALDRLVQRFTDEDETARARMTPVPGSLPFLHRVHAQRVTVVVTGTPQPVIDRTIAYHNLGAYFDEVCGSPTSKQAHLARLLAVHSLTPADCLFIGDGRTDQLAADAHGIPFVGLAVPGASFEPATAWRVVTTLAEFDGEL
jgi:phosphoglycolate phosphatase-like HAD superfamily hydrolase